MNFLEFSKKRKTTYEFSDKKVEMKQIMAVLEAGRWTPSCSNTQPWHFVIVQDEKKIEEIMKTAYFGAFHTRPAVIIAVVRNINDIKDGKHICGYEIENNATHGSECIGMVALNIVYAAQDLGIDSCLLTPNYKAIKRILKLNDSSDCTIMIGLGYEKDGAFQKTRERMPISEIISYEYLGGYEK